MSREHRARSPEEIELSGERPALGRREFLAATATGTLAALLTGCDDPPPEWIVPYVERPDGLVPGEARTYATAAMRSGIAIGLLAASREGRPIKIEGNPAHPTSLGGTTAQEQALVRSLYDPGREGSVRHGRGVPASIEAFARAFGPRARRRFATSAGDGLWLWLAPTSSPLLASLLDALRDRYPRARLCFDPYRAPLARWEGARRAFGRPLEPLYRFERAERVLTLDADVLAADPASPRWARDWASRRRPDERMSRCYALEPTPTCTGTAFDRRFALRASAVGAIAAALLDADRPAPDWARELAADLAAHPGRSLVVVGDRQPPHVHVLGHALNARLGAFGRTVTFVEPPIVGAGSSAFEREPLLEALEDGAVDALLVSGANPAYASPDAARWEALAPRARDVVVHSMHADETARLGTWTLPALHPLELWGDARAHDGTRTTLQPLVRPLFAGIALEELLQMLLGPVRPLRALLLESLSTSGIDADDAIARGLAPGTASPEARVELDPGAVERALRATRGPDGAPFEVALCPDLRADDGRFAANPWLAELPEPITKLVWGNAALLAPSDARALGVETGDVIEIAAHGRRVRAPALPVEGQAAGVIALALGFGRRTGSVRVGVDAHALRRGDRLFFPASLVRPTGERGEVVRTQRDFRPPPEPVAPRRSLASYLRDPGVAPPDPPSLHPSRVGGHPQWGMAIDLGLCTGCSACVVACQAENDVPVVGKAQVARGREMHWLRIDRYVEGTGAAARSIFQPMLCQHCEQAPCEYVCPVNATVHSPDGLNEMVYNRCIGTRFCSNNCPYKVRRFNFFDYHRGTTELEALVLNPDVSVRGRGVMEKCTYCVQRIRRAEIRAHVEARELRGDEVVTACQQACPTGAIVFGAISDPQSAVARMHSDPRARAALSHLGTRPRTRYLTRIDHEPPEGP